MATKYVCNGALCACDKGSAPGILDVKSQTNIFIQQKLMATDDDTTFQTPFFGTCAANQNKTCTPSIETKWEKPASNVNESDKKALLETSTVKCTIGGNITITNPLQTGEKIVIFDDYSPPEITAVKQIISAAWMTGDLKNNIKNASYNEKLSLLVKTTNYETGERITIIVDEKDGKDVNEGIKEINLSGIVNENGFAELKEVIKIEPS